jgi:acyl-CoA reductase-like NAD-dependent aldehyde dehydrogenase
VLRRAANLIRQRDEEQSVLETLSTGRPFSETSACSGLWKRDDLHPPELTPLTALKHSDILTEAGAPVGLFNVVQGMEDTVAMLTSHPGIAKAALTGLMSGSPASARKTFARLSSLSAG